MHASARAQVKDHNRAQLAAWAAVRAAQLGALAGRPLLRCRCGACAYAGAAPAAQGAAVRSPEPASGSGPGQGPPEDLRAAVQAAAARAAAGAEALTWAPVPEVMPHMALSLLSVWRMPADAWLAGVLQAMRKGGKACFCSHGYRSSCHVNMKLSTLGASRTAEDTYFARSSSCKALVSLAVLFMRGMGFDACQPGQLC